MSTRVKEKGKVDVELKNIKDSLNHAWNTMIKADDDKISDIQRLIAEISYTKQYNLFLLDSVKVLSDQILSKRYNQNSMQNSELIDKYDMATDSLVKSVFRLARTTPNIEQYQTAMQLVQDINTAENEVVLYRVKYDGWVRSYNELMKKSSKKVKSTLDSATYPERYFLFSLNQ